MTVGVERVADARAQLRAEVALAARILPAVWPLETFIAVNPLGGFEHLPFSRAIAEAASLLGARGTAEEGFFRAAHAAGRITDADLACALARRGGRDGGLGPADVLAGGPWADPARIHHTLSEQHAPGIAAVVDAQAAKWSAAFLDLGHAAWTMPGRERGLYAAWRDLAPRDRTIPAAARARLRAAPERPDDALLEALSRLGVETHERRSYLQAHLAATPGWAAQIRLRGERRRDVDLVELLALRLSYEAALLETLGVDVTPVEGVRQPAVGADDRPMIWLEAYEANYRDRLLGLLSRSPAPAPAASAQVVFCIDVRSEGIRRHLEAVGAYETFGFAGFFAVAVRYRNLAGQSATEQCPVLLQPRNEIVEHASAGHERAAERQLAGERVIAGAGESFSAAKDALVSPFALAEALGWGAGPLAAAKTLLAGPYGAVRGHVRRAAAPAAPTALGVEDGFTGAERALFAEAALTMMGLTSFSRLVVLCGHGATTENNPYASALDCGACGGNRGGPNARIAAAVLNRPDVRAELADRGIAVPDETWFVAAEHDTATDEITILDTHLVPTEHHGDLRVLAADLAEASARLSAERCATLPGAPGNPSLARARRHVRARSSDWAQVFPEWGLAGNAAFVVGPRSITRGIDLERRVFLHSYEASVDRDGTALETILTAPLVVAQWINCQYYFSSVDPVVFGSGTKTIHNIVGDLGVLQGHDGDLQLGLPWQSVAVGDRLVHEPMRLLAVVQAPTERIDGIIARNTILQHLFHNDWVALAARGNATRPWLRYTSAGWQRWTTTEGSEA